MLENLIQLDADIIGCGLVEVLKCWLRGLDGIDLGGRAKFMPKDKTLFSVLESGLWLRFTTVFLLKAC